MVIRYSIKTLFAATLVVALSFGWWINTCKLAKVNREHDLLLKEWAQPLEVSDEQNIYFRQLPDRDLNVHKWKVYLPRSRRYELQCVILQDSETKGGELDCVAARIPLPEGRSLLEVDFRQDRNNVPRLNLAVAGQKKQETINAAVSFSADFCDKFSKNISCVVKTYGWESSISCYQQKTVRLIDCLAPWESMDQLPENIYGFMGGFEVRIQAIDDVKLPPSGGESSD
jgi:hypothetical protein